MACVMMKTAKKTYPSSVSFNYEYRNGCRIMAYVDLSQDEDVMADYIAQQEEEERKRQLQLQEEKERQEKNDKK
eukprot:UN21746